MEDGSNLYHPQGLTNIGLALKLSYSSLHPPQVAGITGVYHPAQL
jgi:hypothetical protein